MIADKSINLDTLHKVLFDNEKLKLSEECIRKVEESFDFLQSFSSDKIIYGINTGFGPMAQYRIEDQSLIDLQYNIIRSHSTGPQQDGALAVLRLRHFERSKVKPEEDIRQRPYRRFILPPLTLYLGMECLEDHERP